jgi:hypothetical protein
MDDDHPCHLSERRHRFIRDGHEVRPRMSCCECITLSAVDFGSSMAAMTSSRR